LRSHAHAGLVDHGGHLGVAHFAAAVGVDAGPDEEGEVEDAVYGLAFGCCRSPESNREDGMYVR
jgi:hypothetical protein